MSDALTRQLHLFNAAPADDVTDVAALLAHPENQWFDRKSNRVGADKLAECLIGLANADGGRVVVGIANGRAEGMNAHAHRLNDLVQAGRDFASPPGRKRAARHRRRNSRRPTCAATCTATCTSVCQGYK